MRFGRTLRSVIYPPWQEAYIDYDKLKRLLREPDSAASSIRLNAETSSLTANSCDSNDPWSEIDEGNFVEELFNVQLEKVIAFHARKLQEIRDGTLACDYRLKQFTSPDTNSPSNINPDSIAQTLPSIQNDLDHVTRELGHLERYSRVNYAGFLKAAKKHDRRKGQHYRVQPLLHVRLADLSFYREDYSTLLNHLSHMYSTIRSFNDSHPSEPLSRDESDENLVDDKLPQYTTLKFWIHPENVLEVKTNILRHLPVLVYSSPFHSTSSDSTLDNLKFTDPSISSIYLDNSDFSCYTSLVNLDTNQQSAPNLLRIRWYGHLQDLNDLAIESYPGYSSTINLDDCRRTTIVIKKKWLGQFIDGSYSLEKPIKKLEDSSHHDVNFAKSLRDSVKFVQSNIINQNLHSILRINYRRYSYEIPHDDRVRITIDTNIIFIREPGVPSSSEPWHRQDIEANNWEFPFDQINPEDRKYFPFAVLELKLKKRRSQLEWVSDLINSNLLKPVHTFSKFLHGVATLYEDQVNTFPPWLSDVNSTDVQFQSTGTSKQPDLSISPTTSPLPVLHETSPKLDSLISTSTLRKLSITESPVVKSSSSRDLTHSSPVVSADTANPFSDNPSTHSIQSSSVFSRAKRFPFIGAPKLLAFRSLKNRHPSLTRTGSDQLQSLNVVDPPTFWLKDTGAPKVEAKVWLANQRTFVLWQHISVLMCSVAIALFNSVSYKDTPLVPSRPHLVKNPLAYSLAIFYMIITLFSVIWSWLIYVYRCKLIRERSPKHLDAMTGPIIVSMCLITALSINFFYKFGFVFYRAPYFASLFRST